MALPLRLVAALRTDVRQQILAVPLDVDLDAPTMLDALGPDLLWVFDRFLPASVTDGRPGIDVIEHHDTSTRDQSVAAYRHLTADDILTGSRWCLTTDDHHQVSRIAQQVLGGKPTGPIHLRGRTPEAQARWVIHDRINADRLALVATERTDAERAANAAAVAAEADDRARSRRRTGQEAYLSKLAERQRSGGRLLPHELDELSRFAPTSSRRTSTRSTR